MLGHQHGRRVGRLPAGREAGSGLEQSCIEICSTATASSWALSNYCPAPGPVPAAPSNRDYAPGFMTRADGEGREIVAGGGRGDRRRRPRSPPCALTFTKPHGSRRYGAKDFSVVFRWLDGTTTLRKQNGGNHGSRRHSRRRAISCWHIAPTTRPPIATSAGRSSTTSTGRSTGSTRELARGDTADRPALTIVGEGAARSLSPNCPSARTASPTDCARSASSAATACC